MLSGKPFNYGTHQGTEEGITLSGSVYELAGRKKFDLSPNPTRTVWEESPLDWEARGRFYEKEAEKNHTGRLDGQMEKPYISGKREIGGYLKGTKSRLK